MDNEVWAIADIAGQYDALMRLISKFDDNFKAILLGDLVDRGPKSKEVVQWAMDNENNGVTTLMGNHEHMFVDWYDNMMTGDGGFYESGIWIENGGWATLNSYGKTDMMYNIPPEHIQFLRTRMLCNEIKVGDKNFFMSHAPLNQNMSVLEAAKAYNDPSAFQGGLTWNRREPKEREGMIQIFGHNSHWGLCYLDDINSPWAICLDASGQQCLTAMRLNDLTIIQEPY